MEIKKEKRSKILPLGKKTKCPLCKKIAVEPFIPFCSKKCANLDLMKWLSDEYELNTKTD